MAAKKALLPGFVASLVRTASARPNYEERLDTEDRTTASAPHVEPLLTLKQTATTLGLPLFKVVRAAKAGVFPTYSLYNRRKLARLKATAANWNEEPPSILLLKPDGEVWKEPLPGGIFNPGPHDKTGLPFICMRGSFEYHTYSGHLNDKWETHRNEDGNGLVGILMQLAEGWRKANP